MCPSSSRSRWWASGRIGPTSFTDLTCWRTSLSCLYVMSSLLAWVYFCSLADSLWRADTDWHTGYIGAPLHGITNIIYLHPTSVGSSVGKMVEVMYFPTGMSLNWYPHVKQEEGVAKAGETEQAVRSRNRSSDSTRLSRIYYGRQVGNLHTTVTTLSVYCASVYNSHSTWCVCVRDLFHLQELHIPRSSKHSTAAPSRASWPVASPPGMATARHLIVRCYRG